MDRLAEHTLLRAGLIVIACALVVTGCSPASKHAAIAAGGPIRLSPDPAFANARLAVEFGESAPDPSTCRFEWRRNGALISGASTAELEPSRFVRGDRIAVRVLAQAPEAAEPQAWNAEVQVANSPPRLAGVSIVNEGTAGSAALKATVACSDPDGDATHLEYEWTRNGSPIRGAHGPSLQSVDLERGDRIVVTVVADDDREKSPPAASDAFVVENRAPSFTSQPVAPGVRDEVFEYHAMAVDPDGDALHFELVRGPDGMIVTSGGDVHWTLPSGAQRPGEHAVALRATDANGGEAVQEFTIRLDAPLAAR